MQAPGIVLVDDEAIVATRGLPGTALPARHPVTVPRGIPP
jgi:hypothetical protein